MQVGTIRAGTIGRWRLPSLVIVVAMLLAVIPVVGHPARVAAASTIRFPFASGATWYVSQGYNTSPAEGWSHYNCDPNTLKDAISETQSCNAAYQYKYSFDLKRLDGNTDGQTVLSPVTGTIRWIDEAFGGMSIDLGNGYAVAYFHTILADGLAAGQAVTQGQYMGTIAPAGQAGNGGTAHIHLTLWSTNDGGNWSRNAVPFTGSYAVDGYDFPAKSDATKNQYYQSQVTSTNQPIAGQSATVPPVPSLVSPATGTTYTTSGVTPTLKWNASSGATEYQVVLNSGDITSPWVSTTSWTTPALSNGQYTWQVRARNSAGTSALSAKWVFWVDPPSGSTPTPTPSATPSGTPGTLALTLDRTSANYGSSIQATGSGFNANETVNIYLDSISTAAVKTTTANGSGNVSTTFTMPDTTNGNHTFIARGVTSKKQATDTIKMNATIARDPYQGPPGTSIDVTVHGFGANESVAVRFDSSSGALLGTITTDSAGTGSVTITMPQATNGWHDYLGTGATSGVTAYGALYVERIVQLSPTTGAPGDSVSLTARGFDGSTSVTVGWNRSSTVAGSTVCSGTTSAKGNFSCTFTVPQTVAGGYPVTVTESDGSNESATFVVTGPPGIATSPTSGAVMTNFIINGGGFTANEQIRLSWDSSSSAWVTIQADEFGSFVWHATVPSLSTAAHTLKAKGLTSNKTASTGFTVTATGGDNGSSMIGTGTYAVTGTVEGLVGGTTSNDHLITDFDHFVSLPACTATSCPYAVGTSRYYANCGANCYVRVTNPATGACSVAPVYDVGPWFTNDNWWDSASARNLNAGGTAANQLAQGYVGTDAALNGLDVGYGLSNGIGISNVGYEVGNRAAVDIADGTWVDVGFDLADGIHQVTITLLWQSGETYASAAHACGQDGLSASPASGDAGKNVTLSGEGYQSGETVKIYLDSSSNPALASATVGGTGTFSKSVTIPTGTPSGTHRIYAIGQTSGLRTAVSYTVSGLALSLSPSKGPAGSIVQVTGSGYGAGETVKIYLDSSKTPAIGTAKANSAGGFTATVTVAAGTTVGDHRIHAVGQTTKLRTAATFTVQPAVLSIALAPASAQIGDNVQITGSGFLPGETIKLYLDSSKTPAIGSATADGSGKFGATITVPQTTGGSHRIHAVGQTSKTRTAQTLRVIPTLALSATSGSARATLTVSVKGFAANETLSFAWDGAAAASTAEAITTDASGVASFKTNAPWTIGDHVLLVSGKTSLLSGTATYTVIPKLRLTPTSGNSATAFEVRGTGFPTATQVNVFWGSANANNLLCSVKTSSTYGTFTCSNVTPPANATVGAVSILAIGGGQSASATFTVTALAAQSSSLKEPGATPTPDATATTSDNQGASATPTRDTTATPVPTDETAATPTAAPTETVTDVPTEAPTDAPTATPTQEPTPRQVVVQAVADTSVAAATPDQPQAGDATASLAIGGDPESVTLITFQVDGIGAGTVVHAALVLTGSGDASGAGGRVGTISGYTFDEGSLTYADVPFDAIAPAVDANGGFATIAWLDPGMETAIDVTGTVTADGTITFVLRGEAATALAVASRESGAPPRLEITVLDSA